MNRILHALGSFAGFGLTVTAALGDTFHGTAKSIVVVTGLGLAHLSNLLKAIGVDKPKA